MLHALEEQTDGLFRMDDFRPVPCPHPTCSASTYAYVDGKRVTPIPRILDVDDHMGLVANRAMVDLSAELQPALEALWSMAAVTGAGRMTDDLACVACNTDLPGGPDPRVAVERFFIAPVHGFMDEHTYDLTRLMKCCVHQLLPDGRAVPFCAYNSLGYREQTRREQG